MLRLAFDFIITWRETRTRPNAYTWSKEWEYGDPETGGLAPRTYSLGINLTF